MERSYPPGRYVFILFSIDLLAEPDVFKEVKQKLDLGSVKFEVIVFQIFNSFVGSDFLSTYTYKPKYLLKLRSIQIIALCDVF